MSTLFIWIGERCGVTGDPTPDRRKGYHEVDTGGALIKAVINHCAMKGPIALSCGMYRSAGVSRPAPPIGILMDREPVENVAGSGWQFRHRQIADSAAKASASGAPLIAQAATRPAKLAHQARRIASKDHAAPPVQTSSKSLRSLSRISLDKSSL